MQHHSLRASLFRRGHDVWTKSMVLSPPVSQDFQSDSHRTGFAFRIGILSSFRFDSPMQAMIVAMVGFALHTRETLPLHNMCADITFRLGWFERRGQPGKAASMPYGDHGLASHAATEGYHAVCRRDDGFLLVGEQVDAPMPWKPLLFRRVILANYLRAVQRPSHQGYAGFGRVARIRFRICRFSRP